MRASTWLGILILGFAIVVVIPAMTSGQPGGFGKKSGGGGFGGGGFGGGGFGGGGFGGGGMQSDPNAMFEMLAKGRTYFLISETRSLNTPLTQYAQEKGITNGQITRQAYLEFNEWRQKQAAAGGGFGGGGFGGKGFGKKGGFEMSGGAGNTAPSPDQVNQLAELEFKRADRNQDGKLVREEMSPPLRGGLERFDKNGDSMIDLGEYKEYFAARYQGGGGNDDQSGRGGVASLIIQEEDLDAKPVVYRAGGKMPSGLPKWFMDLDTDQDGQVALYEWRRANKSFDDFATWDINADGFITPDEALRQQTVLAKNSKNGSASMGFGGGDDGGDSGEGKRMKMGDFFGKGGEGKKGKGGFPFGGGGGTGERPAWGGGGTGEKPAWGGGGGFPGFPRTDGGSDGGSSKKSKKGR